MNPYAFLTGVLGLIWGSFFNVCITRIPYGESVVRHGSRCPKCAAKIRWYHNVPVLGFLWLRGRCASCQEPISVQYPLVEVATALLFLALYNAFGWSWQLLGYAVFASDLLVISVIDLHHRIIPNELSWSGLAAGFLFSFFTPDITWIESLSGIALGGGLFWLIAFAYEKMTGREGLGGGDVKLLGMIGAWLGVKSILVVVIVSSALGSLVGIVLMFTQKKGFKTAIPFGPFLAGAALFFLFFRAPLLALLYP